MTDREYLELAAKAAGIDVVAPDEYEISAGGKGGLLISGYGACDHWNPLTDDGDALRLAVKLGISVHLDLGNRIVVARPTLFPRVGNEEIHYDESKFGGGCAPLAATRRAIVRAAAEIGRG